jgi:hypothetical protein
LENNAKCLVSVLAPPRDAFQILDWITSRQVHEYLDVAGRPLGEGRTAAIQHVHTEMQSCPYAGSRHHHTKPMNVSALRNIVPAWDEIVRILAWIVQRYRDRKKKEITTYEDLTLVASAGAFLADFLVLRRHQPLRSHEIPVLISGLYKVCQGFQLATFLGSKHARGADPALAHLPNAADFYEFVETQQLLIGEAEVCAGPPALIQKAYEAMIGEHPVAQKDPPASCASLEIAWEKHDIFADQCADIFNDLAMYAIGAEQFYPELAEPALPADVQNRLNAHLKDRGDRLRAGQSGLVVDLARGAQQFLDGASAARAPEPPQPPRPDDGSLAATMVRWLHEVAGADMRAYGAVVASALGARLGAYELHERTVLAGLNQRLSCLMDALGLGATCNTVAASALSSVCGRTLRDWGDTSW